MDRQLEYPADSQSGLSIPDAAAAMGISITTLRRQIRRDQVRTEKVATPSGFVYRVLVGSDSQVSNRAHAPSIRADSQRIATVDRQTQDLVVLVKEQQTTIMELAGRVGYYQAEVEQLRTTLKALQVPKEEPPGHESPAMVVPDDAPPRASWWRWFQR
jgi:hypothetical protein